MGQQQSKDELLHQQVVYGNVEGIKALVREGAGLEVFCCWCCCLFCLVTAITLVCFDGIEACLGLFLGLSSVPGFCEDFFFWDVNAFFSEAELNCYTFLLTVVNLVQWTDREGKNPLIVACMFPELHNVAETLLELGANVNAYRPGK